MSVFFIFFFVFMVGERFAYVILSRVWRYYECKFLFVVWLMFFQARGPHCPPCATPHCPPCPITPHARMVSASMH